MTTIPFDNLSEEQKENCYRSYVENIIYEFGDNAKYMTYEEWYKECREICVMGFVDDVIKTGGG